MNDDPARFDLTGNAARQLLAEHAEHTETDPDKHVRDVQEKHPRARVYWDDEINDAVVDYTR